MTRPRKFEDAWGEYPEGLAPDGDPLNAALDAARARSQPVEFSGDRIFFVSTPSGGIGPTPYERLVEAARLGGEQLDDRAAIRKAPALGKTTVGVGWLAEQVAAAFAAASRSGRRRFRSFGFGGFGFGHDATVSPGPSGVSHKARGKLR